MPQQRPLTQSEVEDLEQRMAATASEARRARERRDREEAWRTTGWGAVGVSWCETCGDRWDGPAYVYDGPWGRKYTCPRCAGPRLRYSTTPQPCEECGRPFVWVSGVFAKSGFPPRPRPRRHLCSDACRRADRAERRRTRRDIRPCAACGATFTPRRADARYCSQRCRQRAYRARNKEAAP